MATYDYCSQLLDAVFSVAESRVAAVAVVDCKVAGTSSAVAVEEYFFAYIAAVELDATLMCSCLTYSVDLVVESFADCFVVDDVVAAGASSFR